jgi:hypothetical protein
VRIGRKTLAAAALAIAFGGFIAAPSGAVTHGTPVANPAKTAPWVVRILFADTGVRTNDAYLVCSGSLIDSRTVLTAGHCVDDSTLASGYYYIQRASVLGGSTERVPVDASWYNPDFDPNNLRGDVSLLHLVRPIKVSHYATLATVRAVPKTLYLYGVGENESYGLPGQMWTTTMGPAGSADIARLNNYNTFDPTTMLAAVNHDKRSGLYSGGCHGDSGGPLVANIKGKQVLYGVVSWGASNCVGTASVFARVTALRSAIGEGRAMLPTLAKQQYRARPELVKAPTISGWPATAGQTLTCNVGTWSNHPGTYAYRWYTQDAQPGVDPSASRLQTYQVTANDLKYPIECTVLATSALNSNNTNVATTMVNTYLPPVIESVSIDDGGTTARQVGSNWSCNASAGAMYPITALQQAARTFTWTAGNDAVLPHVKHLIWTKALIGATPPGTWVTCTISVTNARSQGVASTGTSPKVIVN